MAVRLSCTLVTWCMCHGACYSVNACYSSCVLHAGTPLAPNTPLTITTPTGAYVRTDNATSGAYPGTGTGSTPAEQYMAFHPSDLADRTPIDPYQTAILKSQQTGLYCRLAPLPSNASQTGMVCDQPTAATATPLTYTGDGLSYNGMALVSPGPGQPLMLDNSTSPAGVGPTADNLTLAPALTGRGGLQLLLLLQRATLHCE